MSTPEMFIHKVREGELEYQQFCVAGVVKCVYDTNLSGDLVPVKFTQSDNVVELLYQPSGNVYFRYKKRQPK